MNSIFNDLKHYSLSDIFRMAWSFFLTLVCYPGAKLVRRPISIRGKSSFHYGKGLSTGRNCRIEVFERGLITMGDNCQIGDNVHLVSSGCVEIGNDCLFASKVFISDTSHGAYGPDTPLSAPAERKLTADGVRIGDRVWLGENVCVLPGVSIGDGTIVGAGGIVTRSLPDNVIAVGVPAQPIKRYDFESQSWTPIY